MKPIRMNQLRHYLDSLRQYGRPVRMLACPQGDGFQVVIQSGKDCRYVACGHEGRPMIRQHIKGVMSFARRFGIDPMTHLTFKEAC